jgi:hypothetical protein
MRSLGTGRLLAAIAFGTTLAVVTSPATTEAQGKATTAAMPADLAAAKKALAKYNDPLAAVRDGYFSTIACIDFPKGMKDGPVEYPAGAMGIHLINPNNIGPKLDPMKPQVLLYEQVGDKLKLTGAEWFMPVQVANGVVPSIFGQKLVGPMDGHEPIMPSSLRHYDLHVWLYKDNPKGMFTTTNSTVKCTPKATYTVAEDGGMHMHH